MYWMSDKIHKYWYDSSLKSEWVKNYIEKSVSPEFELPPMMIAIMIAGVLINKLTIILV